MLNRVLLSKMPNPLLDVSLPGKSRDKTTARSEILGLLWMLCQRGLLRNAILRRYVMERKDDND